MTESVRMEERDGGLVALWLDRPAVRNALDSRVVELLGKGFRNRSARAFILGSSQPSAFCSGADLSLSETDRASVSDRLYQLYRMMVCLDTPIIAAIEGPAIGGGAQLALASDLRIGSTSARFRFPGPGHGLSVGAWALPSLVGRGRAIDLCLTMRDVHAEEAMKIGLLDRIEVDPREAAWAVAAGLARLDRGAVARVKAVARTATGLLPALDAEREGNAPWSGSVDGLIRSKGSV